jgi:hypothetical protein
MLQARRSRRVKTPPQEPHEPILVLLALQKSLAESLVAAFGSPGKLLENLPRTGSVTCRAMTWTFQQHGLGLWFSAADGSMRIDIPVLEEDVETLDAWRLGLYLGSLGRGGEKILERALGRRPGTRMARARNWLESLVAEGVLERAGRAYRLP